MDFLTVINKLKCSKIISEVQEQWLKIKIYLKCAKSLHLALGGGGGVESGNHPQPISG
jgi:hypothetical protein